MTTTEGAPTSTLHRLALALWWGVAGVTALSLLWTTVRAFCPVPYWDQWADMPTLMAFDAGEGRVSLLWRLHNEHSIIFLRLVLLADYFFVHGTSRLTVSVIVGLQLIATGLLAREVWRVPDLPRTVRSFLAATVVAILLSATQLEHVLTSFGASFALTYCGAIAGIVAFANAVEARDRRHRSTLWLAAALACGFVGTFSLSSGLLLLPLLALFAWLAPLRRPQQVGVTVVAAVIWMLRWSLGFRHAPTVGGRIFSPAMADMLASFLGTPLWPWPDRARALGAVGLVAAVAISLLYLRRLPRLTRFERVHVMVLWFTWAAAGLTTFGRAGYYPTEWVLVSRFAAAALPFWATLVPMVVREAHRHPRVRAGAVPACVAVVVSTILFLLLPAHARSMDTALVERADRERGELAMVVGAWDQEPLTFLYWDPVRILEWSPFLRERGRSSFGEPWARTLRRPLTESYAVSDTPISGALTATERLPPPPAGTYAGEAVRVKGWAWDAARSAPPPLVLLVDANSVVRGFARPTHVPQVFTPFTGTPESTSLWVGYATTEGPPPLRAYAVSPSGRTASPLVAAPAR